MRAEITDNYLMGLSIEGTKCNFNEENGHYKTYQWIKIADGIDMHIKLSYNEAYHYYGVSVQEYIRGYHAGYSRLETKVKYIDELKNVLKIMGYEIK